MPDRTRVQEQVDRLRNSQTLHGADSLCRLLQYLADHAVDHPGVPLKEYQIATELYGRPADFDPQADSMVRVRVGRLRQKLAEYYESEGANDPVALDIPKGSYLLQIHPRFERSASVGNTLLPAPGTPRASPTVSRSTFLSIVIVLSALLILSVISIFLITTDSLLAVRRAPKTIITSAPGPPRDLSIFWNGFRKGSEPPWVIFSNAKFVGRPDLGLRYYNPKRDPDAVIFDHYTGVGEVLGVHDLDMVFKQLGEELRVKRGSLFTLDEAKSNDLIFIGSPSENLTLLDIPVSREFQFRSVPSGPRKGNTEILNVHSQPGEAHEYLASPSNVPITEDYAVITLAPGLDHEHSVLILAGTTTFGTQAAVEYVSSEESLRVLLSSLAVSSPAQLRPFEALIHVKVAGGVPIESQLVSVRKAHS
jgi:hypothetical protein